MHPFRQALLFLLASLLLLTVVFGDALLGKTLLAPLDIAPALWEKYAYLDPHSTGIPRNQHVVDQLGYDLPLQYLLHAAWRSGEVPWWNPYSMGGRPLLADAHCNGADPIRVATYLAVPDFVTAYNWTRALHTLWGALGVFLLLRLAAPAWIAGGLALAFQVAGWKIQLFGHPWVEGALCWYPWLWLAWQRSWQGGRRWPVVAASFCVTAIFLSGNLQSHAYLPLFALAVTVGWAGSSRAGWWQAAKVLFPSLAIGALLALPLLLAELQLFHLNTRPIVPGGPALPVQNPFLALSSLHPWLLGTSRTGSLKVGEVPAFGFALWAGSIVLPLAAFGLGKSADFSETQRALRRTAVALLVGWLVIIATPLHRVLYARYAGIPVMGLLILAALGLQRLRLGAIPARWAAAALIVVALGVAVVGDFAGRVVYPRFKEKYAAMLQARMSTDGYGGRSARLRASQVDAVPGELSLANPEVALAVLALAVLAVVCLYPRLRQRSEFWVLLLLLNLAAPVLYARRFLPAAPREQWSQLLAGPPETRDFFARARAERSRVQDFAAPADQNPQDGFAGFLPQEFSALQRVHVLHGYAALHPANAWQSDLAAAGPFTDYRLGRDGAVTEIGAPRFAWPAPRGSKPAILEESLCTLEIITVAPGSERESLAPSGGALLRRDTPYPGWSAASSHDSSPIPMDSVGGITRLFLVPSLATTTQVNLRYRPTTLLPGLVGSALGWLLLALVFAKSPRLPPRREQSPSLF